MTTASNPLHPNREEPDPFIRMFGTSDPEMNMVWVASQLGGGGRQSREALSVLRSKLAVIAPPSNPSILVEITKTFLLNGTPPDPEIRMVPEGSTVQQLEEICSLIRLADGAQVNPIGLWRWCRVALIIALAAEGHVPYGRWKIQHGAVSQRWFQVARPAQLLEDYALPLIERGMPLEVAEQWYGTRVDRA